MFSKIFFPYVKNNVLFVLSIDIIRIKREKLMGGVLRSFSKIDVEQESL